MRCEGDKVYDAPGKCPVCGMKLDLVRPDSWTITIDHTRAPTVMAGGTEVPLKVEISSADPKAKHKHPADGTMDLFFVAADLHWMGRQSVAMKNGASDMTVKFPSAGNYLVLARFGAPDAKKAILRSGYIVYSGTVPHVSQTDDSFVLFNSPLKPDLGQEKEIDHHRTKLSAPAPVLAGKETVLTLSAPDAAPGSRVQLVAISRDGKEFMDADLIAPTAPKDKSGAQNIAFRVLFPSPGLYRLFVEYSVGKTSLLAPFAAEVGAATPSK
jgi:hypothetical protein